MFIAAQCTAALASLGLLVPMYNPGEEAELILDTAPAHCQIPCGIFDDNTLFSILYEHITTIEKSMKKIVELSKEPTKNANQLIRWVNNKEQHADEFVSALTKYFLQQRIKTAEAEKAPEAYAAKLATVHQMMVLCMKTKQNTDTAYTDDLKRVLHDFQHLYDPKQDHKH